MNSPLLFSDLPVDGVPHEDSTSREATATITSRSVKPPNESWPFDLQLINPSIIESHPCRLRARGKLGRFYILPERSIMKSLPGCVRIDVPATLVRQEEGLEGLGQDRSGRRPLLVSMSSPPHDCRADTQHDRRQEKAEPKTDVFLGVDHSELTDQGADVDKYVEPIVDAVHSDGRIND